MRIRLPGGCFAGAASELARIASEKRVRGPIELDKPGQPPAEWDPEGIAIDRVAAGALGYVPYVSM